tara:strand:+ start:145 stop:627 length:483 start_codon:yes stop_codon:yes gene_type:complete
MAVSPVSSVIIAPHTESIVLKLVDIFSKKKLNKSLAQNVAITLGRLGLINPEAVAKHLDKIAKQWCVSLRFLKNNNDEKYQAYKGLCYTIGRNSLAMMSQLAYFCSAIVHYKNPRTELDEIFRGIMMAFKQTHGDEQAWRTYIDQYPEDLKRQLIQRNYV